MIDYVHNVFKWTYMYDDDDREESLQSRTVGDGLRIVRLGWSDCVHRGARKSKTKTVVCVT